LASSPPHEEDSVNTKYLGERIYLATSARVFIPIATRKEAFWIDAEKTLQRLIRKRTVSFILF
jgi:hypothetical protein